MKTKIEIKSVKGRVLFEYTTEGNTLAKTVERAIHDEISLHGAYLQGAFLGGANLWKADLEDADLSYANLQKVNLYGANLSKANLSYVNLTDADLYGVNLYGADLRDADLRGADLYGAKNIPFIPTYLPEGEFIAWKKLRNGFIVKLKILEDSKRSRATGKKCRCDKALVLEFQYKDRRKADVQTYTSTAYKDCTYTVGEVVYADSWDENRWNECSHGIHFFINRQDAVNY